MGNERAISVAAGELRLCQIASCSSSTLSEICRLACCSSIEPELHLAEDILVPDLAGWRRERMPERPEVAAFELAPDWICEVLSPSTAGTDRADKLPIYAEHQVMHVWLVDPPGKTLEVLRLVQQKLLLLDIYRDAARIRAEPFAAIELELSALWAK